ncbi:TPA: F0F1 ATP synthase subunit gamma [Methanosarcina acetivorans]|uniref:H(+)-transporting ATP synthase, subunit gamma n=2 Tax=Methanosarcina acetivorans TaxID=2214 RepID=Q8TN60_METAC|nr:F0F1 ATP synthase subunit gamma [Methanosarcina acetivorans]AAM05819.1 H(+)-transporting ATP synthase, subunit gamma [Methanosarcina acetivorans C2A]HIH94747.1 F0F1 ATP synthase subunit gamma [Methanosarcina acetivorans]
MSETTESLRKKIDRANELQSVVRTMKTLAASNIGQYEKSVSALSDYYRTVEMGLEVCFREIALSFPAERPGQKNSGYVAAVVFGSDQGLVGQFNDIIADYAVKKLAALPDKARVWAVGERVYSRLIDAGLPLIGLFTVPNSVKGITPLIGQILVENEKFRNQDENAELYLFYNRHKTRATYEPVSQRLLPLDETWRRDLAKNPWPTKNLPEVMGDSTETLRALIREYLFVSLFRACAESLASENASRLAAMQRADKNIDELLEDFSGSFYRLRQSGIDEELFEVIAGFEALSRSRSPD